MLEFVGVEDGTVGTVEAPAGGGGTWRPRLQHRWAEEEGLQEGESCGCSSTRGAGLASKCAVAGILGNVWLKRFHLCVIPWEA